LEWSFPADPKFAENYQCRRKVTELPIGLGILVFFGVPIAAIIACFTRRWHTLGIFTAGFWILMVVAPS